MLNIESNTQIILFLDGYGKKSQSFAKMQTEEVGLMILSTYEVSIKKT